MKAFLISLAALAVITAAAAVGLGMFERSAKTVYVEPNNVRL